ncbi:DUF2306 domain-containing protein [Croceibacterium aestuarii]|uniref:DUF2306 domain-containing protein n=1 Tax=Croceibacterium aestuarii TaxID=3064139 RepID=UPI00272E055B|nr:DUF2306 domain-containing protein [Croceibacterium sp. D39]
MSEPAGASTIDARPAGRAARREPYRKPLTPDTYEKVLAGAALALLAAVLVALARGRGEWAEVPGMVWAHLATIGVALALTPVMLLRARGDRRHRTLGWIWCAALLLTAIDSLFIRLINRGGFSVIHVLSLWTLIQVPIIVWSARTHNVKRHRSAVRGMVTGALLIAGFFTFPFERMLGHWLFG